MSNPTTIEVPGGLPARPGDVAMVWRRVKAGDDEQAELAIVADCARDWSLYLRGYCGWTLGEGTLRVEGVGVRFAVARSVLVEV